MKKLTLYLIFLLFLNNCEENRNAGISVDVGNPTSIEVSIIYGYDKQPNTGNFKIYESNYIPFEIDTIPLNSIPNSNKLIFKVDSLMPEFTLYIADTNGAVGLRTIRRDVKQDTIYVDNWGMKNFHIPDKMGMEGKTKYLFIEGSPIKSEIQNDIATIPNFPHNDLPLRIGVVDLGGGPTSGTESDVAVFKIEYDAATDNYTIDSLLGYHPYK